MKQLYILRHAKSDYPENISDDHERPLNKRGEKACKLIGRYIKESGINPDIILCSDAVRTTQTIKNILRELGNDIPVKFSNKLYLATPGEILKEIAKSDDSLKSIMIVAHNPGVEQLSQALTGSGNHDAIARLKEKYPTAAMACFSLDAPNWKEINPRSGTLENFITPKML